MTAFHMTHGVSRVVQGVASLDRRRDVSGSEHFLQQGQVADVELSLSVSGPGFAPGSAVLFGKAT
jgi:hypothetical protein